MTEKLSADELQWLREIAVADSNSDRRVLQLSLARLLRLGLVESFDMLTLRITRKGWKCLRITAPDLAVRRVGMPVRYALVADSANIANMRVEKT